MNGNRQMEVHYIDTGFPYTATESFMDFFEGLTHVPLSYAHIPGHVHDQVLLIYTYKYTIFMRIHMHFSLSFLEKHRSKDIQTWAFLVLAFGTD